MLENDRTVDPTVGQQRHRQLLTKSSPQHSRAQNRTLILQTLFSKGALSRADLARESGLTRPTVSAVVATLEADQLVREVGLREDVRIGKPAILLNVNVDSFDIIVVDLSGADQFVGAVVDLRGDIAERASIDIGSAVGEEAVGLVIRLIERLSALTKRQILGIGVGCPGVIDSRGVILEAVLREWSELDLRGRLAARFLVPVHIVNDANLAALGVHSFGHSAGMSLIIVTIENGVGAGIILGGDLVLGEQFSAGEIGHVTVDEAGEPCPCGRRGCLETMIGAHHLRDRTASLSASDRDAVLEAAGKSLGQVIAPVISAMNLTEIVLSGPSDLLEGAFAASVLATVKSRTLPRVGDGVTLTSLAPDANVVLLGGVSLVLAAELGVS